MTLSEPMTAPKHSPGPWSYEYNPYTVRREDPRKVWTLVDSDGGDIYLVSGLHFVNRIGYLLSTIPVPAHSTIQVHLPMTIDDDEPEEAS